MAQARLQAALTEITADLPFRNPIIQAGIGRPLPEAPPSATVRTARPRRQTLRPK